MYAKHKCLNPECNDVFWRELPHQGPHKCPNHPNDFLVPTDRIIAQNSHQSGDTYGVGMALLLDEKTTLLFCTSPEDRGALDKLAYYSAFGVHKDRMIALVVVKETLEEMDVDTKSELASYATVRALPVGTGRDLKNPNARSYDPNQVYKFMVNPEYLDDNSVNGTDDRPMLKRWYTAAGLAYQRKGKSHRAPVSEIGASTRIVAGLIENNQLPDVLSKLWQSLDETGKICDVLGKSNTAAQGVAKAVLKPKPKGVVLLWVRSLSNSERSGLEEAINEEMRQELKKRRNKGWNVDDVYWLLNTGKRNPHHLMTPQLYKTVRYIAKQLDMIVIPIGDQLYFDEYQSIGDTGTVYIKQENNNLIGFWSRWEGWFGGVHRRYRQLLLIWQLFRKLAKENVPLLQIGLRSGEMEKVAYFGIPTIYVEEAASETGSRMLPVTVGGSFTHGEEPGTKEWWSEASNIDNPVTLKDRLTRAQKQLELAQKAEDEQAQEKSQRLKHWETETQKISDQIEQVKNRMKKLAQQRGTVGRDSFESGPTLSSTQLDTFLHAVTDHSAMVDALDGGYPFFFRMLTQNVVGMYAARNQEEVLLYKRWLESKFEKNKDKVSCPANVRKGSLTVMEIDILYNIMMGIQIQFPTYLRKFIPDQYL